MVVLLQKGDLNPTHFSNTNTNNLGGVDVRPWTEALEGIVEKASLAEAQQDAKLGLGNSFAIPAAVASLDDTRGMTALKTYEAVKQNFMITAPLTINLITDLRFPSPQSVLVWLADKRISTSASVTVVIPDGFHDFSSTATYGNMVPHRDHELIFWTSLTAPLPFTRADFVTVGTTAATRLAATNTNYAMLQTKYAATVVFPPAAQTTSNGRGTGSFTNLLINGAFSANRGRINLTSCAVVCTSGLAAGLSLNNGSLNIAGTYCAFLSSGNNGLQGAGGGAILITGTTVYAAGTNGLFANSGTVMSASGPALELTFEGTNFGTQAIGSVYAVTVLDSSWRGVLNHGINLIGTSSLSVGNNTGVCALSVSCATAGIEAIRMRDAAQMVLSSVTGMVNYTITSNAGVGVHVDTMSNFMSCTGVLTFVGCTVDMRAEEMSSIVLQASTAGFSAGATDNAIAVTGAKIYLAGSLIPAGSIPAFGVPDAVGSLVF